MNTSEYGVLTDLVKVAGVLVSATAAIGLGWRGRAAWEPSEEDIPQGPQKVGSLAAAVFIAIIWALLSSKTYIVILTRIALSLSLSCVLNLLIYGFLVSMHTYQRRGKKIIGGFTLTTAARKAVMNPSDPVTVGDYLRQQKYDPDRVWTSSSRALAKLCFVACYLGLTICGSVALSCAAIILLVSQSRQPPIPPREKMVIYVGFMLNGEARYTRDIMSGFRAKLDTLLAPTKYVAQYDEVLGSPRTKDDAANQKAYDRLLQAFPKDPDYLVTIGTRVSQFAKSRNHRRIPQVYIGVSDPRKSGLISSGSAEDENIGGVQYNVPIAQYMRFFLTAFPNKRFGFLWNPHFNQDIVWRDGIREALPELNGNDRVSFFETEEVRVASDVASKVDILFGEYYVSQNLPAFIRAVNLPFIGEDLMNVRQGALATYGADNVQSGALAAEKIVYRSLVENVPVSRSSLLIPTPVIGLNLSVARRYGIEIDQRIRSRASLVIP